MLPGSDSPLRTPRDPAFEHRLVGSVACGPSNDVDASAGGDAKANEYGGMNALARYPRARECGEKVNVAPRLMLDPVDERLAMMVDQVSKGATSERCEAGAR